MESKKRQFSEISPQDIMMRFKSKRDFYAYLTQQVSTQDNLKNLLCIVTILRSTRTSCQQIILETIIHGGKAGIQNEPGEFHQCSCVR